MSKNTSILLGEQKKKALIKALIKGEKSGRIENFDPVAHLAKLHKKHL